MPDTKEYIGEFRADIRNLINLQTQISGKLDRLSDTVVLINEKANTAMGRIDDVENEMITKNWALKAVLIGGSLTGTGVAGIWQTIISAFKASG